MASASRPACAGGWPRSAKTPAGPAILPHVATWKWAAKPGRVAREPLLELRQEAACCSRLPRFEFAELGLAKNPDPTGFRTGEPLICRTEETSH